MLAASLLFIAHSQGARLESLVNQFLETHKVVGMTVCVYEDGKKVFTHSAGYRNLETKQKSFPTDLYRLGSVSKPISAVATLIALRDANGITLDSDARTLLPNLPEGKPKFTLRQLLSHTAGFRHYGGDSDKTRAVFTYFANQTNALKLFIDDDLIAQPGEKYSYSTHGYTVLGAAVETITGTSFREYLRKNIFKYAGPDGLDVEVLSEKKDERTELYALVNDKPVRQAIREDISWKLAGGGMEGTAPGLAKWADALRAGQILTNSELGQAWTRQKTSDGKPISYGLGFVVGTNGTISHTGAQQGARASLYINLNDKRTVVALCNTSGNIPIESLTQTIDKELSGSK